MAPKRKTAEPSNSTDDPALKRPPPKRAKEIDQHTPFDELQDILGNGNSDHKPRNVLHWFRMKDVRQEDNIGLHKASRKAKEGSGSLITMFLYSPKDDEWHGTSPARLDFLLESLRILKKQLEDKNIPLAIIEAAERKEKTEKVMQFIEEHDISHVYGNLEYEVDELRRDTKVAKAVQEKKDLSFEIMHDQTAVTPGHIRSDAGKPMKVFTPYHAAWLKETRSDPSLYDTVPAPEGNDKAAAQSFKELFDTKIPGLPESKQFASQEERDRLRKLWPAGNEAGMKRVDHFLNKKVCTQQQTK